MYRYDRTGIVMHVDLCRYMNHMYNNAISKSSAKNRKEKKKPSSSGMRERRFNARNRAMAPAAGERR